MLHGSEQSTKIAKDAAQQLEAHTSKEWKVVGNSFSQITLMNGNVYVDHLISTGAWRAGIQDFWIEDLAGEYLSSPIEAYDSLKVAVKEHLKELQEVSDSL
jgi:hypothetical protein